MPEAEISRIPAEQAPAGAVRPDCYVDPLFGAIANDGWFPSPAHVLRRAALLEVLRPFPAGRLVEMGCGAGRFIVDWDKLGHSGIAVEPDDPARHLAARCTARFDAKFDVTTAAGGEAFDYLVSTEVLEHVEEPEAVLRDWVAHLKPGGIAIITVPAFQRYWGASDEWAGHVQRFEPDEFHRMMERAGLRVERMRLYGFPIGNWLRILGNIASAVRIRRRSKVLDRQEATFASGRDLSLERALFPILRSLPMRGMLRAAIALQRRFDRGHGLIVVARKPVTP